MDWFWWQYAVMAVLGVAAGVVNILAGGGSNLVLPVLMLFGIPPDVANGSNRIGILLQVFTGIHGFRRVGRLPTQDLPAILLPVLAGGVCGALLASVLPNSLLKPLLLGTMLIMAAVMLFKPAILLPDTIAAPFTVAQKPQAIFWLWVAGVYGGFVQGGVGFVLMMILGGLLRYDLLSTNALKLICTLVFTTVALAVFIWQGKVWWFLGLILAAGYVVGAVIGVHFAVKLSPKIMRWVVFVMTLVAASAALIF
ncbi:sulfite exporter TauE/SafE family protein [Stenoxybacter acetivorans]|uniref:sulfite exporter TauE/SafE family protein n=1 Tax=Stenoxybacter acetivorans TaxID=422441 RepID=UPI0005660DC5|nr:sulfite exporter TauE/SafE family protein [Stenoxybacter acetivorans]